MALETEAGYCNYFQPKQQFSQFEKKWCLPFLRELFCKSKWNSWRGGSEACGSLLFSVGSIQAVLLKKTPKHILTAKLNGYYSQKEIRKQVSHPAVWENPFKHTGRTSGQKCDLEFFFYRRLKHFFSPTFLSALERIPFYLVSSSTHK